MQTFLPYPCFIDSLECLDSQRLGKQRVEAKQILIALGVTVGDHNGRPESQWRNHPAVKMWRGHEKSLAHYGWTACFVWKTRGFRDSLMEQFHFAAGQDDFRFPEWLGNQEFHDSHKSNLLRKKPEHYGRFGWEVGNDLPYVWPV